MDAIADAAAMIRSGEAELAIAGGADAPITPLTMASFIAAGLSSLRNDEPERASRPFDLARDSGVISEGAGVFVLENLERAEARGVRRYVELGGYGKQRDVESRTARFRLGALDEAGPGQRRLHRAKYRLHFRLRTWPSSSWMPRKSKLLKRFSVIARIRFPSALSKALPEMLWPLVAPFQIIACALAIRDQLIPPTANYEVADPACDLDFVPSRPRKISLNSSAGKCPRSGWRREHAWS